MCCMLFHFTRGGVCVVPLDKGQKGWCVGPFDKGWCVGPVKG